MLDNIFEGDMVPIKRGTAGFLEVVTSMMHEITCLHCGDVYGEIDTHVLDCAQNAHNAGWGTVQDAGFVLNVKNNVAAGTYCPDCLKKAAKSKRGRKAS